jgi:hypothetical protein
MSGLDTGLFVSVYGVACIVLGQLCPNHGSGAGRASILKNRAGLASSFLSPPTFTLTST